MSAPFAATINPAAGERQALRRLRRYIVATCCSFALVVSCGFGFWTWQLRQQIVAQAHDLTASLALTLSTYTEAAIDAVEFPLQLVAERARQPGGIDAHMFEDIGPLIEGRLATAPYLTAAVLTDARGTVMYANRAAQPLLHRDAREREFFKEAIAPGAGQVQLSRPLLSRLRQDEWRFSLTRRLEAESGELLGVATFFFDPQVLAKEFDTQRSQAELAVTLIYDDGTIMSRAPYLPERIGKVITSFGRYEGKPPAEVRLVMTSEVDGVPRLIAQRRLKKYPVSVSVSLTQEAALDGFRKALPPAVGIWALILAAIACAGVFGVRQVARREAAALEIMKSRDELAASETRMRAILDAEPECVKLLDSSGRLLEMNRAGLAMIEAESMAQVRGANTLELITPETRQAFARTVKAVFRGEATLQEFEIVGLRGKRRWMEQHAVPLYDTSSPPRVIEMLAVTRDISGRKQAEERARAALREKEVLLKEIYHRVKNNLQVVASLLTMQARSAGNQIAQALLMESADRVKSIALVHEQLYRSGDLGCINFQSYVAELVKNLVEAHQPAFAKVGLRLDIAPVELGVDMAVPLGLITNELISNAYKHAFPPATAGELGVSLKLADQGGWCLTVADTGPGLPAGFRIEECDSLGMRLVYSLCEQIDGELSIENNGGARISIRFMPVAARRTSEPGDSRELADAAGLPDAVPESGEAA